ncbi:MAG TPA: hypothetical protein VH183_08905, partial [Burkholderiaceae bacterium]|nr:hypothetical protein [Burkholderiaceae bacterium]
MLSADPRPLAARRPDRRRGALSLWAAALLLGLACAGPVRPAELPSRSELDAIVKTLRADPDLKTTQRAKVLRLKKSPSKEQAPQAPPAWWLQLMRWIGEAFGWLAETARWLIWLLGALAVALIAVSVRRWARERADAVADLSPPPP